MKYTLIDLSVNRKLVPKKYAKKILTEKPLQKISILFEVNNNARALRDILSFYINSAGKEQELGEFDVTTIGYWLLEKHDPFREEYSSPPVYNTTMANRLQSKRTYIKSRLNELVGLGLIEEKGTRLAAKGVVEKQIYAFTQFGKIFAWLSEAKSTTEDEATRSHAIELFFKELSTYVNTSCGASSFVDLFTNFFKQCIEEGVHNRISNDYLEMYINLLPPISSTFRGFLPQQFLRFMRQILMVLLYTNQECAIIFLELIEESDEQTKELILLELKLDIESYYHDGMGLNLEWEKDRRAFSGDPYNVVLQGYCSECKLKTVYVFGLLPFLKELSKLGAVPLSADSKSEKPVRRDLPFLNDPNRSESLRYMTLNNQYCNIKYNPNASGLIPILYIPPQYLDARGFSPEFIEEIFGLMEAKGATMSDMIMNDVDRK